MVEIENLVETENELINEDEQNYIEELNQDSVKNELNSALELEQKLKELKKTQLVKNVVLIFNNPSFKSEKKSYNKKICGKTMLEWVKNSISGEIVVKEIIDNADLLSVIKPLVDKNFEYLAVFYCDTPLLTHATYTNVIDYASLKKIDALKLTRGYVFNMQYLDKIEKLFSPQTAYFEEEDFLTCTNPKQFAMINDIMRNRILNYYLKEGVNIVDLSSVFIDADATIENDVTIYSNNHILGNSIIESGTILFQDNLIQNSIIGKNAKITKSIIRNSNIENDVKISPFSVIENNSNIKQNSQIGSFCVINNAEIEANSQIKNFTNIKGEK